MTQARLAVVVLTWNGRDDTIACLESLRSQIGPRDAVFVVDNGSSDGTLEAVRSQHAWAIVIENGSNVGFAAGNNAGMRRALGDGYGLVFVLNNDTVVPPGAIEALVAYSDAHPEAGAVQPVLVRHDDPSRLDTLGLEPLRTFGARDVGMGEPVGSAPTAPREIFGASGAAALIRADALRAAGLFDEDLFVMAEDADLAFRLRIAAFAVHLVPSVRVLHRRGISGRPQDPRAARLRKLWLQRNAVALALRYWPARWLLVFAPLLGYRAAQALVLAVPEHRCLALWRSSLARRAEARRAMAARGVDRWFG